jgi:hypothetical protein
MICNGRKIAQLEDRLKIYEGYTTHQGGTDTDFSLRRHTQQIYGAHSAATQNDDDMTQLLRGVNYLTIGTRNPEFYGGSSPHAIIDAVEAEEEVQETLSAPQVEQSQDTSNLWLDNAKSLRFAEITAASLPPRSVADEYVNRYFQTAHHIYPILDRVTFMTRYMNFWEGLPTEGEGYELWAAVLYMVLAHGHQCSTVDPDDRVRVEALSASHGETCFKLAKSAFADVPFSGGDISAVHSLFLAVSAPEIRWMHALMLKILEVPLALQSTTASRGICHAGLSR